jgi:DNA-directed RNA polymerase subunit beta
LAKKTNTGRIDFSSIEKIIDYPDFLDLQLQSFQDFLQIDTPAEKRQNEGLYKVFAENFPITDSREHFVLEFVDYYHRPS